MRIQKSARENGEIERGKLTKKETGESGGDGGVLVIVLARESIESAGMSKIEQEIAFIGACTPVFSSSAATSSYILLCT